jgi:hypothetical protein
MQGLVDSGSAFGMKYGTFDIQAVIGWLSQMELYSLNDFELNEAIVVLAKLLC